ncbi:hypothetical protein F4779DRAFT_574858 [Xylariaceae sp. FL0662B]|nr:hypothetical protein F4779DRAFT_574858 [Xylariaceae sp. FL0662B]
MYTEFLVVSCRRMLIGYARSILQLSAAILLSSQVTKALLRTYTAKSICHMPRETRFVCLLKSFNIFKIFLAIWTHFSHHHYLGFSSLAPYGYTYGSGQ